MLFFKKERSFKEKSMPAREKPMFAKIAKVMLAYLLSMILMPTFVMGEDVKEDRLAKALKKYEITDNVENCISVSRIHSSNVIDDNNILFIMKGGKAYLNKLPHRCPGLGFQDAFGYKVHNNQLCKVDIITVFSSAGGIQGPSCGLGKFLEYKKKPSKSDDK